MALFTDGERAYLASQRLGRLATVDGQGAPQNNPVGFVVNDDTGTVDIGGMNLPASRKFHNVIDNQQVAFVIDDIVSEDPWVVRGIEIRGAAEALSDERPPMEFFAPGVIRIHPHRIFSWGVDTDAYDMVKRDVDVDAQP